MRKLLRLAGAFVTALILAIGAAGPAMASVAMQDCMVMAGDHDGAPMQGEPIGGPSCAMPCLACLVAPGAVRISVPASWSDKLRYMPVDTALAGMMIAPELPPPRE